MAVEWRLTLSLCGGRGCEMHYAGEYRGVAVQFVRLPKRAAKSGATRIYVERDMPWNTRPEHPTEAALIAAIDGRLGNSELHPKEAAS